MTVLLAKDGPDGIALARESQPALILVDINIPGLDGYETTTRLRGMAHLRGTPIVALTADSRVGARERSLVAGCDGYITKPIDPRGLPEQLSEFIGGKREALPHEAEAPLLREYNHKLVERLEQQVRELTAANAELQELDQLKSQFLATLSHELRTPLTSILGYLDLFERGTLGAAQRDPEPCDRRDRPQRPHADAPAQQPAVPSGGALLADQARSRSRSTTWCCAWLPSYSRKRKRPGYSLKCRSSRP